MTTTRTRVTKREAERTLNAVKRMFSAHVEGDYGPKLIKNWEWGFDTSRYVHRPLAYDWAIVWEEGSPYNWTYLFPHGGIDEEFGFNHKEVELPDDVWTEPITGWAIAIYPKDW
jgi:hypothetical protein